MFEDRQKNEVDALLASDAEFRDLYRHHKDLDRKVHDAEIGILPMDSIALSSMKREKLRTKDRLTELWDRHQALH
ncbi:MAG: YdcH family protein [Proteobacteria bacterium]|nr:YdcH family protein [Pseudomonadota bacterium]